MIIREIKPEDNAALERIIKDIFIEFELPLIGTTYEDHETTHISETFKGENEFYLVIEDKGKVLGGAGIKPLNEFDGNVCEFQKMYFHPILRGKGYGKKLLDKCLKMAAEMGFEQCYLESGSQLKAAIHLYEKDGFRHIDAPLGNTGHYACGVWMLKDL